MNEQWKPIEGTDGRYEVSNAGKIRSMNYKMTGKVRELKPSPDPKGYIKTMLTINKKSKTIKVHREVAKAFIENPDNLPQVNHKDGNKENNSVENLEWIANRDNAHHAIRKGLFANSFIATAEANEKRKKPIIAVKGDFKCEYGSIADAARELGLNRSHIQRVLKGERKAHKGYVFFFARG